MSDRQRTITLDPRDVVLYCGSDQQALHTQVKRLYEHAKQRALGAGPRLICDQDTGEVLEEVPRVWRLTFSESEDDRSLKQNRFYWGPVLTQISERADRAMAGGQWSTEAWHELFKRKFLGFEVVKAEVPHPLPDGRIRLRKQVYRRLRSTTKLSVKQMSEYLDKVIAYASTELNVAFELDPEEREAVRYHRPKRKAATTERIAK